MADHWPPDTAILDIAKPFIKAREGYRAAPYLDTGGVPTIGWGTTRYPSGAPVTMRDVGFETGLAEVCITAACMKVLDALHHALTRAPTAHEAAALVSFGYNEGVSAMIGSRIVHLFNNGDVAGAAEDFGQWNMGHVGGKFVALPGLTKRRAAERAMFLTHEDAA